MESGPETGGGNAARSGSAQQEVQVAVLSSKGA
jgi:hypothetical protein